MATLEPETGLVIRYRYLWQRQARAGEETGRKARPACVVIPIGAKGADVVLFPLTTQPPGPDRVASPTGADRVAQDPAQSHACGRPGAHRRRGDSMPKPHLPSPSRQR